MKRILFVLTLLALLLAGQADAQTQEIFNWHMDRMCIYPGSDSAGAVEFTPVEAGVDTLTYLRIPASGAIQAATAGMKMQGLQAWGAADSIAAFYPVCISNGNVFPAGIDSLGITVQGSPDASAATPFWTTVVPKAFVNTDGGRPFVVVTNRPFPDWRVLVTWNDNTAAGGPTQTLGMYMFTRRR